MNYEFKGTPGPWRMATKEDNEFIGMLDTGYPYNGVRDYNNGCYAGGKGFQIIGIIREEDARLMASAPDLLAICIEILNDREANLYPTMEQQLQKAVEKALNINQ